MLDVDDNYWVVSDESKLLSSIKKSTFDFDTALTEEYITNVDLFTCNLCPLECGNGASVSNPLTECQNCDDGCPIESNPFRHGLECNQVFWISSFRLNMNYYDQIKVCTHYMIHMIYE